MFCPSCKHENPEHATFCGECGATLVGMLTCNQIRPVRSFVTAAARCSPRDPRSPPGRELREAHRLFVEVGAPARAAEVAKELGS